MPPSTREATAVLSALCLYRARIVPLVRREVGHWRGVAETIPDPVPREQALAALGEKGLNVEATAVFATLAPRRARPTAVRAMTALHVAVDYLDTLGEQRYAGVPD
jgi:tetraprenyl-beta-curcumene synthase